MDAPGKPLWTALTPSCRSAFLALRGRSFMASFYLAGDTALALQIGHRVSRDLDWFSSTNRLGALERESIRAELASTEGFSVEAEQESMMYCAILGTEVSFIYQRHPLLRPVLPIEGLAVASVIDIGLMKLAAVKDRGTRRDFDDAEAEPMPALNEAVSWEEVKRYAESGALSIVRRERRG